MSHRIFALDAMARRRYDGRTPPGPDARAVAPVPAGRRPRAGSP